MKEYGELSPTGIRLNEFLKLFKFTVDNKDNQNEYVYSSDIVHCYPGKDKSSSRDRKPDRQEISNCLNQTFLMNEIKLVEPKFILLMGKVSRDNFYEYILKESYPESLSNHITEIVDSRTIPQFTVNKLDIYVLPIQHPSVANARFKEMTQNDKLIELIREVLR